MGVELETDPLRAIDPAKRSTVVRGSFERADAGPTLDWTVDRAITVAAERLRFDDAYVVIQRLDAGERDEFSGTAGSVRLEEEAYRLRLGLPVTTYVRFDGAATLASDGDAVSIAFDGRTAATIGFRSRTKRPRETVTAPPTPAGVAAALSRFAADHHTSTADRSFPSMRPHPPIVSFEEGAAEPAASFDAGAPEIRVPPDLGALLTVAPLAYYLGARVRTDPGSVPTLAAGSEYVLDPAAVDEGLSGGSGGVAPVAVDDVTTAAGDPAAVDDAPRTDGRPRDRPQGSGPSPFESCVAATLRRAFYLDCVVRNAGEHGSALVENAALDRLDLDADRLHDAPVADRVGAYLAADYESVAHLFPEWHLSLYLEPDLRSVRALPHVLDNVPQVYRPRSRPLEGDEWLSRSLDDFYRARAAESADLVNPDLGPGRTHGWLAADTPIDVFKTTVTAYENRARHRRTDEESISIVAVVNEREMASEGAAAAETYRRCSEELELDVTVRERVGVDELARTFEGEHEFVHFIGHCEPDGLVCVDGRFDASTIAESNVQTFFLNACGSYRQGLDLIEKGSVVGGATFNRVLNDNAARVGSSFARLLMGGFCFERALSMARRRIMSGKDYVVVGDGTHSLTQMNGLIGGVLRIDSTGDAYRVTQDVYSPGLHGGIYRSALQDDDRSQLYGNPREFRLSADELRAVLDDDIDTPVVFDGDLRRSGDVAELLS